MSSWKMENRQPDLDEAAFEFLLEWEARCRAHKTTPLPTARNAADRARACAWIALDTRRKSEHYDDEWAGFARRLTVRSRAALRLARMFKDGKLKETQRADIS